MIVDTTFVIDLSHGDPGAAAKVSELKERKEPFAITVVSEYEIWRGSARLRNEEAHVLNDLIGRSMIITLEPEAAQAAGIINHSLRKKGIRISSRDSLIAGIVMAGNDVLLTRNIKDFSRITGLKLETY